jgi:hypothetical protein
MRSQLFVSHCRFSRQQSDPSLCILLLMHHHQYRGQDVPASLSPQTSGTPEFLIISLFALRLTKQLIERLGPYPGRDADIAWIAMFLTPYSFEHALAKVSGARAEDYTATYPEVVSRMKTHPRYPTVFMGMNPDRSMSQRLGEKHGPRDITDGRDRVSYPKAC